MVGKKDMNELLSSLERILLEYQGMKYILNHPPVAERWRSSLNDYRRAPEFAHLSQHTFDEVRDSLQSDQPDAFVFASLTEVLNQATTL
jgi:hypothetical protein